MMQSCVDTQWHQCRCSSKCLYDAIFFATVECAMCVWIVWQGLKNFYLAVWRRTSWDQSGWFSLQFVVLANCVGVSRWNVLAASSWLFQIVRLRSETLEYRAPWHPLHRSSSKRCSASLCSVLSSQLRWAKRPSRMLQNLARTISLEFVDTTCGNEGLTACEAVCATSNWHISNMPSLIGLDSDKAPTTQCGCLSILIHAGNFIMYGGVNGQLTKQSDDYQAIIDGYDSNGSKPCQVNFKGKRAPSYPANFNRDMLKETKQLPTGSHNLIPSETTCYPPDHMSVADGWDSIAIADKPDYWYEVTFSNWDLTVTLTKNSMNFHPSLRALHFEVKDGKLVVTYGTPGRYCQMKYGGEALMSSGVLSHKPWLLTAVLACFSSLIC